MVKLDVTGAAHFFLFFFDFLWVSGILKFEIKQDALINLHQCEEGRDRYVKAYIGRLLICTFAG